jgi:hypothetical protein
MITTDVLWLLAMVAFFLGGFTHIAAFMAGVYAAGMWLGFRLSRGQA